MAKYHCTYCQNPIKNIRIKCTECPEFDLCLQCFSCGAEAGSHKKDHDYQILEDGCFMVFEDSNAWTSNEELALLEAVEQYGFGNWEDVSGHVESRTAEDCKDHYYCFYLHGNIGKATFPNEAVNKVIDHTCPDNGPLSPSLTTPLPPVELSIQEQQELGYMPFRDDFEREYDNESETLVSGLSVNYDDEDIDIAVKLAQVDIYRQRLKERQRRKRIAREYGLISTAALNTTKQKSQNNKKKMSKDEKEFQEEMRVFAQFHSTTEHEHFFENLQKERQMKNRIKELVRYRRNGITKLEECSHFDAERVRREKKKENKKKMGSTASAKRTSMVSKKAAEEKIDLAAVDEDDIDEKELKKISKDMASLPGYEMLSNRERKLCHSIGMKPASYITIKTCIIKDYLQRRQGYPIKIRYPNHLDKTHRRKILNFLTDNGWIGVV